MRPMVRVLLAGVTQFNQAMQCSLSDLTEIVGSATSVEQALELADELRPDVVVADKTMIASARLLAGPTPVVFLFPPRGRDAGPAPQGKAEPEAEVDLLETVFALVAATPAPPEGEDDPTELNGT